MQQGIKSFFPPGKWQSIISTDKNVLQKLKWDKIIIICSKGMQVQNEIISENRER
jgi:hypothetical protein